MTKTILDSKIMSFEVLGFHVYPPTALVKAFNTELIVIVITSERQFLNFWLNRSYYRFSKAILKRNFIPQRCFVHVRIQEFRLVNLATVFLIVCLL